MVNKIFKPAENVATASTFEPSEEEKASLYSTLDGFRTALMATDQ